MTDRTQYVSSSNHCSAFIPVRSGVPESSILRPKHFSIYLRLCPPLLIHTITHHSFADNLILQMSAPLVLHSKQSCISDVVA